MKAMHIRTWFGSEANYIYRMFKTGKYTVDDIIERWNDGLGERDTDESEEVNPQYFDELHISSNKEYLVGFSNMEDKDISSCDIFEIVEKEAQYGEA